VKHSIAGAEIGGGTRLAGPVIFLLIVAAAMPVFLFGFQSLAEAWLRPEYSHGPIIPVLSAYMFLREMRRVPPPDAPVRDRWPGVALLFLGLVAAGIGNLVKIPDIVTYGFIIWVAGLILIAFGFSRGFVFWTGVLHLVYMLPLPMFLQWKVTTGLQYLSSELGVWFLRLAGVPVLLEGNIIDLGPYKLQVAEACSGLRYLFPILSFSYVFCVLYNGPRWHKAVLLLSAAPITIVMNSVRIAIVGVLVDRYGIEMADGFLHLFEGWVIFGICVGILFLIAILLQRLQRHPRPIADTLDVEFSGLGPQLARVMDLRASRPAVAALSLTLAVSAAFVVNPRPETVLPDRQPFALFPTEVGIWSGISGSLDPDVEQVLAADDYLSARYSAPGAAASVDLFVAWYRKQTEGQGIHSPEVCIPSAGWEIARIETVTVDRPASGWAPFQVNRAVIEKGTDRRLVYFWFEQRGERITNDFTAKLATIRDSIREGRSDGGLVRLITAIGHDEPEQMAEMRLLAFIDDAMPLLPGYLPE
jgi:exosortase D (VPLPA-CTERM-specific)